MGDLEEVVGGHTGPGTDTGTGTGTRRRHTTTGQYEAGQTVPVSVPGGGHQPGQAGQVWPWALGT